MEQPSVGREAAAAVAGPAARLARVAVATISAVLVAPPLVFLVLERRLPGPLGGAGAVLVVVAAVGLGAALLRSDVEGAVVGTAPRWPLDLGPIALAVVASTSMALLGLTPATSLACDLLAILAGVLSSRRPFGAVMATLVAGHAAVMLQVAPSELGQPIASLAGVVLLGWLAGRIRDLHTATLRDQIETRRVAERQSRQLAVVAGAAGRLDLADTDLLLHVIVETARGLGWDRAALYVPDASGERMRTVGGNLVDLPDGLPRPGGLLEEVLAVGRTVVRDNYRERTDGNPELLDLEMAVGAPVMAANGPAGALVAGRRSPLEHDGDIHLLELLAAQAGRAVENARAYYAQLAARRALERGMGLQDEFVATMSHELRTPMHVVLGMAETLDERWDGLDAETRARFVTRLRRNAADVVTLLESLLDFSRLRAEGVQLVQADVELAALVQRVVARWRTLSPDHLIALEVDGTPGVRGDEVLLERVVDNLVSNACRHTPMGTSVRVVVGFESGTATLSVVDDGPGIAPETLSRLGERYYRGEAGHLQASARGLGIGLAFAKEVLQAHDADLEISSAVGGPTSFGFRLPCVGPKAPTS